MIQMLLLLIVFNTTLLGITPVITNLFNHLEIIKKKQALLIELRYVKARFCAGVEYKGPLTIKTIVDRVHFIYIPENQSHSQLEIMCFEDN